MANISSGSVCGKLIIYQYLVIVEQHIWYQIEAKLLSFCIKVRKTAKIGKRYNQVPHLTQDTTWLKK